MRSFFWIFTLALWLCSTAVVEAGTKRLQIIGLDPGISFSDAATSLEQRGYRVTARTGTSAGSQIVSFAAQPHAPFSADKVEILRQQERILVIRRVAAMKPGSGVPLDQFRQGIQNDFGPGRIAMRQPGPLMYFMFAGPGSAPDCANVPVKLAAPSRPLSLDRSVFDSGGAPCPSGMVGAVSYLSNQPGKPVSVLSMVLYDLGNHFTAPNNVSADPRTDISPAPSKLPSTFSKFSPDPKQIEAFESASYKACSDKAVSTYDMITCETREGARLDRRILSILGTNGEHGATAPQYKAWVKRRGDECHADAMEMYGGASMTGIQASACMTGAKASVLMWLTWKGRITF